MYYECMEITFFGTIILSLVQGITEFLPISSSGHLVLAPAFFGFSDPGLSFSAGLHIGTLGAVIAYFRRDIYDLAHAIIAPRKKIDGILGRRYIGFLIIATVPAAIAGFFFEDVVAGVLRVPQVVAGLIVIVSMVLWYIDRRAPQKVKEVRKIKSLTYRDVIFFGFLQSIAIVPGISRSGATIIAGRWRGFSRHAATRFSFLMAIPIIFGATILELPDIMAHGLTQMLLIGAGVAFIAAYATIALFLQFIERVSFGVFVWYSIVLFVVTLLVTR